MTFVDFSKAFDFVQREFLLHKLLNLGIVGKLYTTIKSLYSGPVSCIALNGYRSDWFEVGSGVRQGDWFEVGSGVRQGDSLSPILFASFINDLGLEMNELNKGLQIHQHTLNLLMYADDIVCLAPDHKNTQMQLDLLSNWCDEWGMFVNVKKTQVVHVRHHQKPVCKKPLFCIGKPLDYVRTY